MLKLVWSETGFEMRCNANWCWVTASILDAIVRLIGFN